MVSTCLALLTGVFSREISPQSIRGSVPKSTYTIKPTIPRKSGRLACYPATMIHACLGVKEPILFLATTEQPIVPVGQEHWPAIQTGLPSQASMNGLKGQ